MSRTSQSQPNRSSRANPSRSKTVFSVSTQHGAQKQPERHARTVFGDGLDSLAAIYEPDVNVCVVKCPLSFVYGKELPIEEGTVRCMASEGFDGVIPDDKLVSDLTFIASLLSDLTGCDEVGVRVHHSIDPRCPKLHVDHVPLRLVCTYVGAGTEWVDQSHGDRWFDCGSTDRQGTLRQASAGDIVLLKGEGWVGNEGRGAAHRSPAHQSRRLVASFDPLWFGPTEG